MTAPDRIKILVLGDSGVGKSSLVHLITHPNHVKNGFSWTIGCSIEIKLHEYNQGTPSERTCLLELWDIGGSRSHFVARPILYTGFHGIILVHDLTNRKSHENLRKWLSEVFSPRDMTKETITSSFSISALFGAPPTYECMDFDKELFIEKNVPVLVIGCKLDLASEQNRRERSSSIAQECGAEEIFVDCHNEKSFAPASTNSVKLSRFFDKVVERKYNSFSRIGDRLNTSSNRARFTMSGHPTRFSHLD